ncbi:hypothetical protein F2Q69_00020225 [Brassica cretica]|uniref:RING-type domain-containing protein n=1 Tax=Brassica cretica TaxID=69181 RepID=A0A8S9QB44_BRACR|nr:hypothetical protein F2Q69_00020225 [Brassica cretica]
MNNLLSSQSTAYQSALAFLSQSGGISQSIGLHIYLAHRQWEQDIGTRTATENATSLILGTSASPKNIPIVVLFVPLFLLQGARVLFITYISLVKSILWIYSVGGPYGRSFARSSSSVFLRFFQHGRRFVEKSVLWIYSVGVSCGRYFAASTARIFRGFFQHGVRLLGCWSVDEGSQEEQARLYTGEATGYNTFSPEVVKKMPKSDLVEEVRRLQAALSEQTDISKQEYEKLQDEKILCKVCIVEPIDVVLLPCKHRALCSTCYQKCEICPICRSLIEEGMHVYDA